jgi:hypothetical protein
MLLSKQNLVFLSNQVHYELLLTVPYRRKASNLYHGVGKQKFKVWSCAVSKVEYKILYKKKYVVCSRQWELK